MTYELAIGDRTYSSWSLRGWLLFAAFDLPVNVRAARMYSDEFKTLLMDFQPSRLVPAARLDGTVVWDTLAIAEELAQRHPDAGLWPSNPRARAMARAMSAEMHSGFADLRTDCTMNLRRHYPSFAPSDAVLANCARITDLWASARSEFGADGPWLFGKYSIADVFYAPAATRFATYDLPTDEIGSAYIDAHLNEPNFRRWRAMGLAENYVQPGYDIDLPEGEWTGPAPLSAQAVDDGSDVENTHCPYSGDPVTHFFKIEGRVFGTCNAFCRDKTVADPAAWDQFMAIYKG
ncbi:glutathione S-transferase [Amylibacter marinus]|uniref:Glutathione S-transferase n=1 Tax=Amylibacter marinus TaxID=1475483 RepID=A0ABQ5VUU4_9RHOB|nr:glutathione S-transferase [Amylibacter marinus]GLQ34998.1 glutathione S-transferase [Amylibacter marinus]